LEAADRFFSSGVSVRRHSYVLLCRLAIEQLCNMGARTGHMLLLPPSLVVHPGSRLTAGSAALLHAPCSVAVPRGKARRGGCSGRAPVAHIWLATACPPTRRSVANKPPSSSSSRLHLSPCINKLASAGALVTGSLRDRRSLGAAGPSLLASAVSTFGRDKILVAAGTAYYTCILVRAQHLSFRLS
jgi:hypothetical protein